MSLVVRSISRAYYPHWGSIYSANATDIVVHLYIQSETHLMLNQQEVIVHQKTQYPWDGAIAVRIEAAAPFECNIRLRIPGWCHDAQLAVNGESLEISANLQQGYVTISRLWQPGDTLTLVLAMPIERLFAHPAMQSNVAHVALQRGPLVYCLEEVDNDAPPWQIILPDSAPIDHYFEQDMLNGVVVLRGMAQIVDEQHWDDPTQLYCTTRPPTRPIPFTAIPYYAWDNRQPGVMRVWLHASESEVSLSIGKSAAAACSAWRRQLSPQTVARNAMIS